MKIWPIGSGFGTFPNCKKGTIFELWRLRARFAGHFRETGKVKMARIPGDCGFKLRGRYLYMSKCREPLYRLRAHRFGLRGQGLGSEQRQQGQYVYSIMPKHTSYKCQSIDSFTSIKKSMITLFFSQRFITISDEKRPSMSIDSIFERYVSVSIIFPL